MTTSFKFKGIDDTGGGACCPHCGSEGRYIYNWEQDGKGYSAMVGCFKLLTGRLDIDDKTKYFQLLAEKQAKNKPLNGWDKTVIRMQEFIKSGKYSEDWCNQNIDKALSERQIFLARKRY
jgi:hypothetical protein